MKMLIGVGIGAVGTFAVFTIAGVAIINTWRNSVPKDSLSRCMMGYML